MQELVDQETERFTEWWDRLQVMPTIAALNARVEQMRRAELAKTLRRLDASEDQREQLEAMTKALVRRILHDPISTLREHGDRDLYLDAAQRLFRLDESTAPPELREAA